MAGSPDVLSGTFAGRYTIDREIGSGATATVYLARDTQRGINVAVKLLRPELAQSVGADRFLREIRLNERLHHPHIVPVLDSGEHDARLYFVLPHMEDGSLRQLLMREKQLPIDQAIAIARTVAHALDYAHQHNLIHRDVKPENILFTSGQACLADFGIAKAVEKVLDQSTTESGMVRGTPAYMSPEQASGSRQYDGRSDQYSLACVLYEMLAGVPAFIGATPEAVIAQRFQHPPRELRVYRPAVPAAIAEAIERAMSIVPADRFATAAEFASALDAGIRTSAERSAVAAAEERGPSRTRPWHTAVAGLAIAGVAIAFIALKRPLGTPEVLTFVVPPPTGALFSDNLRDVAAVSPDGRDIVVAGTDSNGVRHLWLRSLSNPSATRIEGTEAGSKAFWSPDGQSVGFFRRGALHVIDRDGGIPRRVVSMVSPTNEPRGGSWSPNGTILYAPGSQSGIYRVSLSDSSAQQLTAPAVARGEIGHMWPQALPGGRAFLYYVASAEDSVRGIYWRMTGGSEGRRLAASTASGVYSAGRLLYIHEGALVAQELDVRTGELTGERRLVADSIAASFEYYGAFSASENGVLVYAGGRSRDLTRLVWMDTAGLTRGHASDPGNFRNPALSLDGRRLAFETYRGSDSDLRIIDLRTGVSTLLPDDGQQALDPMWSPDGSRLAFISERPGDWALYRTAVHGSGESELLFSTPRYTVLTDWAPGFFILTERNASGNWDLIARRLSALETPLRLAGGAGHQVGGRVSRNGRFLAYVSTESGVPQVYAQRFPTASSRCQVSAQGGHNPVWGSDGTLYFLGPSGTMMRARLDLTRDAPCPVTAPHALFETDIRNPSSARSFFDFAPASGRFLVNAPSVRDGAWLNVIVNWHHKTES